MEQQLDEEVSAVVHDEAKEMQGSSMKLGEEHGTEATGSNQNGRAIGKSVPDCRDQILVVAPSPLSLRTEGESDLGNCFHSAMENIH